MYGHAAASSCRWSGASTRAQARAEAGAVLGRAGFAGWPGTEAAAHQGGENDFSFLFSNKQPQFHHFEQLKSIFIS
jgi:hypothetical protein